VTELIVNPVVLPKTNPHVKYQCYTMSSIWEMDLNTKFNHSRLCLKCRSKWPNL